MSGQRMGWFSMSGYTIAYDPPLSSFEKEFKAVLQKGIKDLDNVNIFYRSKGIFIGSKIEPWLVKLLILLGSPVLEGPLLN